MWFFRKDGVSQKPLPLGDNSNTLAFIRWLLARRATLSVAEFES
jgi:hypothetical protein